MLKADEVRKVLSIKLNLKAFTLSVAFIFVFDIIFFSINEQIRKLKSLKFEELRHLQKPLSP